MKHLSDYIQEGQTEFDKKLAKIIDLALTISRAENALQALSLSKEMWDKVKDLKSWLAVHDKALIQNAFREVGVERKDFYEDNRVELTSGIVRQPSNPQMFEYYSAFNAAVQELEDNIREFIKD